MFGLFKKSGPKKASINSGQHEITVEPNQNLLDAALKSGVNFPHDCRVGSCGSCTCKLTKGKIKKLTDFSYVLTLDQLDNRIPARPGNRTTGRYRTSPQITETVLASSHYECFFDPKHITFTKRNGDTYMEVDFYDFVKMRSE